MRCIKEQSSQRIILHRFQRIWNEEVIIDRVSQNIAVGKHPFLRKQEIIPFKAVIGIVIYSRRDLEGMLDWWEWLSQPLGHYGYGDLFACINYQSKKHMKTLIVAPGSREDLIPLRDAIEEFI